MSEEDIRRGFTSRPLNRRRFLAGGAGVAAAAALAACGDDKDSGGSATTAGATTTTAAAETTTTAAGGTATTAAGGGGSVALDGDFIKKVFASGGGDLGGGKTIKCGAGLLLSTSQAYYGQQSLKGIALATEQIKAAGGPDLQFDAKDLSVTPTAGADIARGWGESGIHLSVGAGFFGTGSMLDPMKQYKIICFDPGGGTSTAFQGKPYAYGMRAITPDDSLAGVAEYIKQKMPDAKRWAITGYDIGELTAGTTKVLTALATSAGAEVVGSSLVPLPGQGNPDYPGLFNKLRGMKPDVIFNWVWGSDPANFMKQYSTSGLKAPVVGPDFGSSTVDIAGKAFDGYMFAYDYFDPDNPTNDWGKFFVQEFRKKYNEDPDYYPANYYENTFFIWELIKRVLAAGGDVNDGDALDKAVQSKPEFASVYGDGSPTGLIAVDPTTHTVTKRPLGLFQMEGGKPKPLAYFDLGAKGFKLA